MCNQRRILVVDDDNALRQAACLRLRSAGYETREACDGRAGVAAAVEMCPDVIVMDVRMPEMDGLQALTEMRRHRETKSTPIVMLSGSIMDRQTALSYGARFFLTKPCPGQALVDAVSAACRPHF